MASCLAVTPTGDVRYWPSIAHDGSSVDVNGILEGQEFDELVSLSSVGYVLATTTCNGKYPRDMTRIANDFFFLVF